MNATKPVTARTRLNNARKKLASLKPNPELLKNRKVVVIDDVMKVDEVEISTFLAWIADVEPIQVQRNERYRLEKGLAKHLAKLALPQHHFAVVVFNGVFYLVDGNTRKRSWLANPLHDVPNKVFVTLMVIDSMEEGEAIYGCYDSKQARKRVRDDVLSLARRAGKDVSQWHSPLLAGGKFVSVVNNMARHLYGAKTADNQYAAIVAHLPAFDLLDRHHLDEGVIPAGAVWAALRLYTLVPAEYQMHVTEYIEHLKRFGTAGEQLIPAAIRSLREKACEECAVRGIGTSGEKPIPVMFPVYLEGFFLYAKYLSSTMLKSDKTFKTFLTKSLQKAINDDVVATMRLIPQVASV